jgi:hypothetical protein
VLTALAGAGSGCATVASGGGGDQTVKVVSDPPGATVLIDGRPAGTTPAAVPLARKAEHQVEVSAPGYETARLAVKSQLNPWVFGNILVGGLIGIVVDLSTGATSTLSPDELTVKLRPLGTTPVAPGGAASPASGSGPYPPLPPPGH